MLQEKRKVVAGVLFVLVLLLLIGILLIVLTGGGRFSESSESISKKKSLCLSIYIAIHLSAFISILLFISSFERIIDNKHFHSFLDSEEKPEEIQIFKTPEKGYRMFFFSTVMH